jgi:hypothetical protein
MTLLLAHPLLTLAWIFALIAWAVPMDKEDYE